MKKLPELYKNKIDLTSHNKKCCYIDNKENIKQEANIEEKIKNILSSNNYLNNIPVIIKTKEKEYKTSIVSKLNNNVLTLNNELIPVNEIISIEVI